MTIITICGSTRFKKEFEEANKRLTLEGNIVLSVGLFGHADNEPITIEQKIMLDDLHKKKIDLSEGIYVVNVGGYIGESIASEIKHARETGKFVMSLEEFEDDDV